MPRKILVVDDEEPIVRLIHGWHIRLEQYNLSYLTKPFNPMELIVFVKRIFAVQNGANGEGGGRYTIN
jgi:hypothetical protein